MFDAKIGGGHALEIRETDLTTGTQRVHDRVGGERLHEHEPGRLRGHAVQLPARVLSARAAERHAVGHRPVHDQHQFEIGHFEPCTRVTGRARSRTASSPTRSTTAATARTRRSAADTRRTSNRTTRRATAAATRTGGRPAPNLVTGLRRVLRRRRRPGLRRHLLPGRLADVGAPEPVPEPVPAGAADHRAAAPSPKIQFVTDTSATEADCDLVSGAGLRAAAEGTGALLPVLDAGQRRREVRVGVRQHAQRQHVRARRAVRPRRAEAPGAFAGPIRPVPECG